MITIEIKGIDKLGNDLQNIAKNMPKGAHKAMVRYSRNVKSSMIRHLKEGAWVVSKSQAKSMRPSRSLHVVTQDNATYIMSEHPAILAINDGGTWQINKFWVHDSNARQIYFRGAPLIYSNYAHTVRGKHFIERSVRENIPNLRTYLKEECNVERLSK